MLNRKQARATLYFIIYLCIYWPALVQIKIVSTRITTTQIHTWLYMVFYNCWRTFPFNISFHFSYIDLNPVLPATNLSVCFSYILILKVTIICLLSYSLGPIIPYKHTYHFKTFHRHIFHCVRWLQFARENLWHYIIWPDNSIHHSTI